MSTQRPGRGSPTAMRCLAVACVALGLSGCATQPMHGYYYGDRNGAGVRGNLIAANEHATDALLHNAPLDASQPVLVATLVNVDRLHESSRLGRLLSEQMAARMVQRGLRVTEVKLRDSVLLEREQGERLLSRDVRDVSLALPAQAVGVGTYAVSGTLVYINLKLVGPVGNAVLAAHSYALAIDENVRALLAGR